MGTSVYSAVRFFAVLVLITNYLTISSAQIVKGHSADHENRLLKEVINKYSPEVRPTMDSTKPVNFTLDITFNNIIDVDEKHQILKTSIWVRQFWTNPLTVWNASEYGGLKEIIINSNKIWQPDTALYNNIFEEKGGRLDVTATRVRLSSNGFTFWAAPFIFKTVCKINVKNFPFDTQECKLTFGTWQYHGNEVNIQNTKKLGAIASTRVESGEWEVLKVVIEHKVIYYQCCPKLPYPEISFIIHMKRRSLFYVVNLILPNVLISLLAFFSFYIPVECGERISFVITVLLSMTVFLLLVAESIPPTSEAVPVIGIYYTFSIFEVFLALVATGISLKINYSYMFGDGLSPSVRNVLFKFIGPFLGFNIPKLLDNDSREYTQKPEQARYEFPGDDLDHVMYSDSHNTGNSRKQQNNGHIHKFNLLKKPAYGRKAYHGSDSLVNNPVESSPSRSFGGRGQIKDCANTFCEEYCPGEEKQSNQDRKVTESKLAAAITDRFFMVIFSITYLVASAVILIIPAVRS